MLVSFSATNRSPFGAVLMTRGVFSPEATISTVKPGGTCGIAPCGIGAFSLKFFTSLDMAGRS